MYLTQNKVRLPIYAIDPSNLIFQNFLASEKKENFGL